jgi:hypothetical protein
MTRVEFQVQTDIFVCHYMWTGSGFHPAIYVMGVGTLSAGEK